jgi:2-amino-4-hydroxy-6-hydroxymethyldihydropteridine diphosphokinase
MQAIPAKRYINIYLSIGSNVGARVANVRAAFALIDKNIGKIARKSHLYETQPWGKTDQEAFINQVVMANTYLDPRAVLEEITKIERQLGRERGEKWGPRVIDVDILFYGKRVIRDKGLEIPHPELHQRMFILVPFMEMEGNYEHPILGKTIDQLYEECKDPSDVVQLEV